MSYEPFVALKLKTGDWGFFVDSECKKLYYPFDTQELAQAEADRFVDYQKRPERFLVAWRAAVDWLSHASGVPVSDLVDDSGSAKRYQDLPPLRAGFEKAMGAGSGVSAFAVQAYSFYNATTAVDMASGALRDLTPFAAAALIDEKGRQCIVDLTMNYAGW